MGELILHRGTRHGFRVLVERLRSLVATAGGRSSPPVALVVGSSAQRRLLVPRLARELGGAFLGIEVVTPAGFARRVLEQAGEDARLAEGETAFRLLVRRAVREHPVLGPDLSAFDDGEGLALGPVRDLLGAGLHREAAEALLEAIDEEPLPPSARNRARALVEVAVAVAERMEAWSGADGPRPLARNADRVALAAELLGGPVRDAWRAVLCWGLPDAPGRTADLLAAILRLPGGLVLLDEPPDPVDPARPAAGEEFRRPFVEALAAVSAPGRPGNVPEPGQPALAAFHAADPPGEAREIARRILALLDAGTDPEEIAVVARGLEEFLPDLAAVLDEQGIPWSLFAPAPAGLHPAERSAACLANLLTRGPEASVDDWLDARALAPGLQAGLSLLLRTHGRVDLRRLAAADPGAFPGSGEELFLPVREPGGDGEEARPAPRRLPRRLLAEEVEQAGRFLARLREGPAGAFPAEAADWLRDLLAPFGAGDGTPRGEEVAGALVGRLPPDFPLEPREAVLVAAEFLRGEVRRAPGGRGGGVRVMNVLRARGVPFRVLFLAGMNRDVFPRVVRDDPLLPDAVRRRLRAVLPALPLPLDGHDEERWLFAHLLAAADRAVLSWRRATADGAARHPSPFVRALELHGRLAEVEEAGRDSPGPRSLEELAVAVGRAARGRLAEEREAVSGALGHLLAGAAERWGSGSGRSDPAAAARARVAVAALLAEWPAPGRPAARLALPWFGFVVPGDTAAGDEPPWVTHLEQLARCPWRAFLERVLRVEPPADAEAVPGAPDPLVVGIVAHRTLARLLAPGRTGVEMAEGVAEAVPVPGPPDQDSLDRVLLETARDALAEEGIATEPAVLGLARMVRPMVEAAFPRLAAGPGARVAGAELNGSAAGVRFRADLVLVEDGRLLLVDWKTGRPFSAAKKETTRRAHFLRELRRGTLLQAAAYAALALEDLPPAAGRYVYLAPGVPEALASWTVEPGDEEVAGVLGEAVSRLDALARSGPFFPRLLDEKGNGARACGNCAFRDACLAGETDATRRLAAFAEAAAEAGGSAGTDPIARFALAWSPPGGRKG